MRSRLWYAAAAAFVILPVLASAQIERATPQRGWVSGRFALDLARCSTQRLSDGFAISGTVATSPGEGENDGLDVAVTDTGGVPTIAAHAINTKGTGSNNGREAGSGMACGIAPSPRGTIPAGRNSGAIAGIVVGTCALSGDADAPEATFTVPLSAFGSGVKTYIGHVTLIKREAGTPAISEFASRKSYDKYSELANERSAAGGGIAMKVVAACDASGLSAKAGKPSAASWDLAVAKGG
jgi:hypothetical protein